MRHSTWIGGLALIAFAVFGWYATQTALPVPPLPAKIADKAPADDRDELANKLLERIALPDGFKNVALKEVLEIIMTKYDINVLVDAKSFGGANQAAAAVVADDDGIMNQMISVPAVKNVRLSTLLKLIADQINGAYLIYPDHIKLVGIARVATICGPFAKANMSPGEPDDALEPAVDIIRAIPLVSASFNEKPLVDALKDVEMRTNRSIVLANQAGDKAKTVISARFTNVPVETAVATLSEMAGL